MNSKIILPPQIEKALELINKHGYEGYLVGGCVRDYLLNIAPYDFDLATNALPEEIKKIFADFPVIETGIKHGTVTAVIDKMNIEITTYRIDGNYKDNRRPDGVTFIRSLTDDLSRRDFTVNAMAYSPDSGIIDYFNGVNHLKSRIICCVGDSQKRFEEDALRIMRALRFASVLSFEIEEKTAFSIHDRKDLLKNISRERIFSELIKLLCGNPYEILLSYADVMAVIIPDLENSSAYNSAVLALKYCPEDKYIRLAAFLYSLYNSEGLPSPAEEISNTARKVLNNLKSDSITVKRVTGLLINIDEEILANEVYIKLLAYRIGFDGVKRLIALKKAISSAKSDAAVSTLDEALRTAQRLESENACISLKNLAVNGQDLIGSGIKDGRKIGEILNTLLFSVIRNEVENTKDKLLEKINIIIEYYR